MSPMQLQQPGQPQRREQPPAGSPEAIELALAVRRARLADDVEALAAVMAPAALASTARRSVQDTAAEWRRRAKIRTARLKARVGRMGDDPLVRRAPAGSGSCPMGCARLKAAIAGLSPGPVRDRLVRLVEDARDGEPVSLAVVTGTVVVLTGVGVAAVIKAVRR